MKDNIRIAVVQHDCSNNYNENLPVKKGLTSFY